MRLDDPYLMLAIAAALGVVAILCSLVQLSIRIARRCRGRKIEVDSLVQQADETRSDILGTKWPWGHDDEDQETQ